MRRPPRLLVAHQQQWVVDDMVAGTAGRWPVHQLATTAVPDPSAQAGAAWWATTGHAARLRRVGAAPELTCVPAGWLAGLDQDVTGRTISVYSLSQLPAAGLPAGFVKPATAKIDQLPAGWRDNPAAAATAALAGGTHPDTVIEYTPDWLQLAHEWRVFTLDGFVCRPSAYRVGLDTWAPAFDARTDLPVDDAWQAAAECADHLYRTGTGPPAAVLDLGCTRDGRWFLLEANAPWSANPYGCPLTEEVDVVVAASTGHGAGRWRWSPDPHETAVAAELAPLPASHPLPPPAR